MFRQENRFFSYLLKPEIIRRPEKAFDPFTESPIDGVVPATIIVKVSSFSCLLIDTKEWSCD